MFGDASEDLAEVGFRIQAIELGGADQAVKRRRPLATGIGAREEIVLSSQGDSTQRAFGGVVVDLDSAILAVTCQRVPPRQRVTDGAGNRRFTRGLANRGMQPGVIVGQFMAARLFSKIEVSDA